MEIQRIKIESYYKTVRNKWQPHNAPKYHKLMMKYKSLCYDEYDESHIKMKYTKV